MPAQAALSLVLATGNDAASTQSLVIDSNKCPAFGPVATYVAVRVTNTGSSPVSSIQGTISGLGNGVALTGTQGATQALGALGPGASRLVGWHVTYSCIDGAANSPTITISGASVATVTKTVALTVRFSQSAAAGGNVLSTVLGAGAVVGQTISADVTYDFGNINSANEFIMQPAGNTAFDARCLQLVRSQVISSNIVGITTGTMNQLYFTSPIKQSGNGYNVGIRYFYRYLCAGVTSVARPYAAQTSGGTNIKYTGNYDTDPTIVFSFPTPSNPFTIAKSVNRSALVKGNGPHSVTYTVTITNPSPYATVIDQFTDTLPAGVSFQAIAGGSGVTTANSASTPASGASGTIGFSGLFGSSYTLAGNSSLSLVYSAAVPDVVGTYTNSASAIVGNETIGPASASLAVGIADLIVSKTSSVNGAVNQFNFALPGSDIIYTVTVTNSGSFPVTADSLAVVDSMPALVEFYNGDFNPASAGMGAFRFNPGTSSLTCCTSGRISYSNGTGPTPSFTYTPAAGYDGNVTYWKVQPSGILQPGESFSVQFRSRIE